MKRDVANGILPVSWRTNRKLPKSNKTWTRVAKAPLLSRHYMAILRGVLVALALCVASAFGAELRSRLHEEFSWKEMTFAFPNDAARNAAEVSGDYIPANNLPLGLARWRAKLFVTVPRWKAGVASTLNYVPLGTGNKSPSLIPYPDWETNKLPKGSGEDSKGHVISTFRVSVDACDRLWVMDTGVNDIWGNTSHISSPKIMVFDLLTDKLLREFHLKESDRKENSFFANIIVDVTNETCENAYAYLPDLGSYGLIVYSWNENETWRIKHHYFHFDPLNGNFHVGGVNFQWTDGLFGLALSPVDEEGHRTIYFHPLSSLREFSVSTRIVRNKTLATDTSTYYEYKNLGFKGENSQATASFLDEETGVLFFTQINKNGIGCWNTNKTLGPENVGLVAQDDESYIFPNDLKVDHAGKLWVLTDKLPVYLYKELKPEVVNYRIFSGKAKEVVKGTVCE